MGLSSSMSKDAFHVGTPAPNASQVMQSARSLVVIFRFSTRPTTFKAANHANNWTRLKSRESAKKKVGRYARMASISGRAASSRLFATNMDSYAASPKLHE